ncbi:MAG: prenyltransferase [Candidatus Methylumidiphilus sp.]
MISIQTLFIATRPQYLLLSIVLVFLGAGVARMYGPLPGPEFVLCLAGLVLLHISTNVLNDYFDYTSGIDLETQRTPFNGGSGVLNQGLLVPRQTLAFGLSAFALAVPIGGYLVAEIGWPLLPLFVLGAVFVLFGTSHMTRLGFGLGELSAGLGLGALPVFGTAWILHGSPDPAFMPAAVPSALWVFNLLFLNEFPDECADRRGGRKTLATQLGFPAGWRLYVAVSALAYLWVGAAVWLGFMPKPCLLVFLTLPLAVKAAARSRAADFGGEFTQAQAANVGLALLGHALLALGYWVSA